MHGFEFSICNGYQHVFSYACLLWVSTCLITCIPFDGKRVLKHTLCEKTFDSFRLVEYLTDNGLLRLIVPHHLPKGLNEQDFQTLFISL